MLASHDCDPSNSSFTCCDVSSPRPKYSDPKFSKGQPRPSLARSTHQDCPRFWSLPHPPKFPSVSRGFYPGTSFRIRLIRKCPRPSLFGVLLVPFSTSEVCSASVARINVRLSLANAPLFSCTRLGVKTFTFVPLSFLKETATVPTLLSRPPFAPLHRVRFFREKPLSSSDESFPFP